VCKSLQLSVQTASHSHSESQIDETEMLPKL
jgi:hypothetical protein